MGKDFWTLVYLFVGIFTFVIPVIPFYIVSWVRKFNPELADKMFTGLMWFFGTALAISALFSPWWAK